MAGVLDSAYGRPRFFQVFGILPRYCPIFIWVNLLLWGIPSARYRRASLSRSQLGLILLSGEFLHLSSGSKQSSCLLLGLILPSYFYTIKELPRTSSGDTLAQHAPAVSKSSWERSNSYSPMLANKTCRLYRTTKCQRTNACRKYCER